MPISYKCPHCSKYASVGKKCECRDKMKAKKVKYIPENSQKRKPDSGASTTYSDPLYHSAQWKRLRSPVMEFYSNMDIYSWYKYGRIEAGFIVHHIIPLKDDYDRRFDMSNLIYLTDANHKAIHSLYDESEEKKAEVQQELFDMIEKWKAFKRNGFSPI